MKVVRRFALGLLLVAALTGITLSAAAQTPLEVRPVYGTAPVTLLGNNPYQLQSESAQLAKQYVDAKETEKTDVRKHLLEVLNHQFDQQVQEQQKELDDLEKQITQLKTVLRKRLDAKSTIVERRAEQLIQDASGLGWNAPSSPHVAHDGQQWFWGPRANGAVPKISGTPQAK